MPLGGHGDVLSVEPDEDSDDLARVVLHLAPLAPGQIGVLHADAVSGSRHEPPAIKMGG